MKEAEVRLQVFYDLAMSIGNSLDMNKMLQESLSTYMQKFNLAAGAVLQGKFVGGDIHLEPVYAIPRIIHDNRAYKAALENIPEITPADKLEENLKRLPLTGRHGSMAYHIMSLPNFGLLVLLKSGDPLETYLLKLLERLNHKLAVSCRACQRQSAISQIAADLKRENRTRKKAEEALAEAHERLLTILDSLDVLIFVADLQTHEMIFMNRHMETLLGSGLKGRPCFEVFQGKSDLCPDCNNDTLLDAQGRPVGVRVWEDRNPLTHRWYIHQARAIKWIDGRWVRLQISTDITQMKQMERERIEAAHLQQTQRLEALGILAGGVAHEYNNLLMSMLGNLSLLNFKVEESHPFKRYLKKIEKSIRMAANLTDQLLGYAQKGRYEDICLQMNALIRDIADEFSKSHKSIRLRLDLDKALLCIECDQRQIEHVLWNLFSNAGDAMPDGGDLHISTRNVKRRDLRSKPYVLNREDYIELAFKDTGMGMTAEIQDRIFDPFYTTKPMAAGKGVGLGMAATYGIIKAHEGFIEVASEVGRGSRFLIYLPAYEEAGGNGAHA